MKFCATHWTALREAISSRGLDGFISKNGEEAAKRMAEGTFDPLLAAHNAIVSQAVRVAGLGIMVNEGCPICSLNEGHKEQCKEPGCSFSYEPWIGYAADESLEQAKKLGLVASS